MQFSLVNCLSDYLNFKEFCERANFSPRGGATVESFSVADGLSDITSRFPIATSDLGKYGLRGAPVADKL